MIKVAGNRISPQEIEEAALSGGEAREAVAIGVPDPAQGGRSSWSGGDAATEPALRTRLKTELPNFMQPARIVWHDELPRNANGKLDRAGLRRAVLDEDRTA